MSRPPRVQPAPAPPPPGRLGRLLLVEPDTLTAWSLSTYLRRWFDVHCTSASPAAQRRLRQQSMDAVLLSDQLPRRSVNALVQAARQANRDVRVIILVAAETEPATVPPGAARLEKPFELPDAARLLGVPETELAE
ncbi:MAG: hypothetical protein AB1601_09980 [Planctomycetota bacterium]